MKEFYFDDIVSVTSQGIILCNSNKQEVNILFCECVNNFSKEFPNSSGRCVATSDILNGHYTFYTEPKTLIKIRKKKYALSFFDKHKKTQQFVQFQKKLYQYGFKTYDLT